MAKVAGVQTNNSVNNPKYMAELQTHSGHKLSMQEAKFLDSYIRDGNQSQAVINAGYKHHSPASFARKLLSRDYIQEEVAYRLNQSVANGVASANEVLLYFTKVMRGEVKDQFGLDASLSERTKAAQELAKRLIDMPNKTTQYENTINVHLDWRR